MTLELILLERGENKYLLRKSVIETYCTKILNFKNIPNP